MRVLMVSVEYPPVYDGGLGIAVAALSSALADQGVAVDVVTRGPADATERDGAVTVHRVAEPDRSAIADEGYSAFLRWVDALADRLVATGLTVARERGVDVVHGHEWHAGAAARRVAAGADRPLVATIHATERGKASARRTAPRVPVATAERTLAGAAQAVTVASHWLAAELEAGGLARERIAVLPFGVELRPAPAASAVRRARRELAAPEQRPILLAGRLVSEKGFQDAIAALPLLRRDEPDAAVALAGEGWYEPALRKATARAGVEDRVRFLGRLEPGALAAHYRAADLVVMPSRYEPFGLVALEAMAAGRPLLAAAVGGLAELLPPGEPAMRFPPRDPETLAARAAALLGDAGSAPPGGRARPPPCRGLRLGRRGRAVCRPVRGGGRGHVRRRPVSDGPLLSVVVASHERPRRLGVLLDALAAQTAPADQWEVVVVHDSSGTATDAVLRDHPLAAAGRLRALRFPAGTGSAARMRNAGWRAAAARSIAFTDDDCRPDEAWLATALRAARARPTAILQGSTRPDPRDRERFGPTSYTLYIDPPTTELEACNAVYPRAVLERVGGFDESIRAFGEDTDLALRAKRAGAGHLAVPGMRVYHGIHALGLRERLAVAARCAELPAIVGRNPELRWVPHRPLGVFLRPGHAWLVRGARRPSRSRVAARFWPCSRSRTRARACTPTAARRSGACAGRTGWPRSRSSTRPSCSRWCAAASATARRCSS